MGNGRLYRRLFGPLMVAGLVAANLALAHLHAQDPNCNKFTGSGPEVASYTREGCGSSDGCKVQLCQNNDYVDYCHWCPCQGLC